MILYLRHIVCNRSLIGNNATFYHFIKTRKKVSRVMFSYNIPILEEYRKPCIVSI